MLVAVGDRRAALRRPHGVRLRRSVCQARPRRCAHHVDRRHLDRTGRIAAARRPQPGRLELLRRLPAEAAARRRTSRRRSAISTSAPIPSRLYIECTAACNISCNQAVCAPETGITRTRQAGMLDFDLFTKVIDEAGPVARPHRLLQLRRSVPAQARRRDVRVHQDEVPAHLPLHQHQRPGVHRREGPAAGALGHRRSHLLARWRVAGDLRAVPPARQLRQGDRQPARPARRARQDAAATCRSSTGATSCSSGTTPTRRWTRRARWPPSSASIACAGRSPIIPRIRSRGASRPARRTTSRIRYEIWDNSGLGNAIPGATPRAEIDVHTVLPDSAVHDPRRRRRSR